MSENTNPETGGSFQTDSLIDEQTANTKFITIQDGAPSPAYDGMVWNDTTEASIVTKVYDGTNTQWMIEHPRLYTTSATFVEAPTSYAVYTGFQILKYNTGNTYTRLYFKVGNNYWMAGTG